jgi:phenylalanyl-tRNA synthetase beta subunit
MTSVTVRVIFSDEGRSLVESEADQASQKILEAWRKELEAELRG